MKTQAYSGVRGQGKGIRDRWLLLSDFWSRDWTLAFLMVLGILLTALPARSASPSCAQWIFFEFQTVSTNRSKPGTTGFLSWTNRPPEAPRVYQTNTIETYEFISITGGGLDHASTWTSTEIVAYPKDTGSMPWPDPASCPTLPSVRTSTAQVSHDGSFVSGCGDCQAQLLQGDWFPNNTCAECHRLFVLEATRTWEIPLTRSIQETEHLIEQHYEEEKELAGITYSYRYDKRVRQTLSGEYDTAQLSEDLREDLARLEWPEDWGSQGVAAYVLALSEQCAQATRLRFQIRFLGPQGETGDLDWIERFIPRDGTNIIDSAHQQTVTFSGREEVLEFIVEAPLQPGRIEILPLSRGSSQAGGPPGLATIDLNGGLWVQWNLGQEQDGSPAGFLYLQAEVATRSLATPGALHAFVSREATKVLQDGTVLRQVKTAQALADIQVDGDRQWTLRFYPPPRDATPRNGAFIADAPPFASWTLAWIQDNPPTLRLSHSEGSAHVLMQMQDTWTWIQEPSGLRMVSRTAADFEAVFFTNIVTVQYPSQPPAFIETSIYQSLPYLETPCLISKILGAGTQAVTSAWAYYDDLPPEAAAYGKLKFAINEEGSWQRFHYDPVTGGLLKVVSGFLNHAPGTPDEINRETEHHYPPLRAEDAFNPITHTPYLVVERLQGHEIARRYQIALQDRQLEVQCLEPGASWDDPSNLITETSARLLPHGFESRTRRPDGHVEIRRWETNVTTGLVSQSIESGFSASATPPDPPLTGTRTVHQFNAQGLRVATTRHDLASGLALADLRFVYDAQGRSILASNLVDGTSTETHYACCHPHWSRDPEGTVTTYTHDTLGRLIATTRHGITLSNVLDAHGQLLAQWRIGTDGSIHRLLGQRFDQAGRLFTRTNALGQVTSIARGFDPDGRSWTRTLFPDGGVQTEYLYRDGSPSEISGSAVRPARYQYGIEMDQGLARYFELEILPNRGQTNQWIKTLHTMIGETYQRIYASSLGQPPPIHRIARDPRTGSLKESDPDGVTRFTIQEPLNQSVITGVDRDGDGALIYESTDPVTQTMTRWARHHGTTVRETQTWVATSNHSAIPVLLRIEHHSVDGLQTWITEGQRVESQLTVRTGDGSRVVTRTRPDGRYLRQVFERGRVSAQNHYDALDQWIEGDTFHYDAHGRLVAQASQPSAKSVVYAYDQADQIVSESVAIPGQGVRVTSYQYDARGRLIHIRYPDGSTTVRQHDPAGQVIFSAGPGVGGGGFEYDDQGRRTRWHALGSTSNILVTTQWHYDPHRGFLARKQNPDGRQVEYDYTPAGRLASSTNARLIPTAYAYNHAGELIGLEHDDNSPRLDLAWDRQGRITHAARGSLVTEWVFDPHGLLLREVQSTSPNAALEVAYSYDPLGRLTSVLAPALPATRADYRYDVASRVREIQFGNITVLITNLGPGRTNLFFQFLGQPRCRLDQQWNPLGQWIQSSALPVADTPRSFTSLVDLAGRRIQTTLANDDSWRYRYDGFGQIRSARKSWSDGSPVALRQFRYEFDSQGNRILAGIGGDPWGRDLAYSRYQSNPLNQYFQRSVPGVAQISGRAAPESRVTINHHPTQRHHDYFAVTLPVPNLDRTRYATITNLATRQGQPDRVARIDGLLFVPQSPERFNHDPDGNLLQDGRWRYDWDSENRLRSVESLWPDPAGFHTRLVFDYDSLGRRLEKSVYHRQGGSWTLSTRRRFLYAGWYLIAELDSALAPLQTALWFPFDPEPGLNHPGPASLLVLSDFFNPNLAPTHAVLHHDLQNNVSGLVSLATGTWIAEYEHGPFGEPLQASGSNADGNPFRFAARYQDLETGLVYFGRRYYHPTLGRWLSRDPLEEQDHLNLYIFVQNDPLNNFDLLGLETISSILVKRKEVDWLAILRNQLGKSPHPGDPYGHWWIEMGSESYGWWPKSGVSMLQTLTGVPGRLNGTDALHAAGLATETMDAHHGDSGDEQFHPQRRTGLFRGPSLNYGSARGKRCRCAAEPEMQDCLRDFAAQYSGNWSYPWGQNCHSFQRAALRSCCLKK